jgi:hypothetical protein
MRSGFAGISVGRARHSTDASVTEAAAAIGGHALGRHRAHQALRPKPGEHRRAQ